MVKLIFYTIIFGGIVIYHGCSSFKMPFAEQKLAVLNNSNITLGALINLEYPDTSINNTFTSRVYPKEKDVIQLSSSNWRTIFSERKKITVFFVPASEIERYHGFNKDSYTILKKYILAESTLDSLKWTLTYP